MDKIGFEHFPDCTCRQCIDHPSQARLGIHVFPGRLHVVTMLENPLRWRSRYANYWAFNRMVEQSGAILYTAELAFGERHFEITEPGNPRHIQLRLDDEPWGYELWHKENALNLAINRLPHEAKYIAWIDCDVNFARPDWAQETLHLLQHYQFLQMFSHSQDLGPQDEPVMTALGYVHTKLAGLPEQPRQIYYYGAAGKGLWVHPGFAWAARRDALNRVGGLVDWSILGSGDWIMAAALMGEVYRALNARYHPTFNRWAENWAARAERHIKRNVGVMPGLVLHRWHGTKKSRNYDNRWKLLFETQFNPETDIRRDAQGLWVLNVDDTERMRKLRDGLRKYASLRNEDANAV